MHQAGRYRGTGKPILASALRAREIGRDPIPRKALWPAANVRRINRSNTWPHRPALQNHSNPLAKGEPSTHGEIGPRSRSAEARQLCIKAALRGVPVQSVKPRQQQTVVAYPPT